MAEPIRIRAQMQGDVAEIRAVLIHPMETGQRKENGKPVPAHFIQQVIATINGKVVLDAQWNQSVSKNPFLAFRVKDVKAGDKVTISWVDNKGGKNSAEATIH